MRFDFTVGCTKATSAVRTKIPVASRESVIAKENANSGDRQWLLEKTAVEQDTRIRCPWIEGYCSRASVKAGERISFHVSTNPSSEFTIDLYRTGYYAGDGARCMANLGPFVGQVQPDPRIGSNRLRECNWKPCVELEVPEDWLSGVYVGKLTALDNGHQSYVIFILRDERRADFVFQCSDATWQAYNRWPDHFSLYDDGHKFWYWGPGVDVSFDRPYGRYCQIVDAPLSTGSGEWFLWEYPVAYWMESHGFDVTYVSNLDTHSGAASLDRCKGFLSVGHDEYYTLSMFNSLKRRIAGGASIAFFSGNTCHGRIDLDAASDGRINRVMRRVDVFGPRNEPLCNNFPEAKLFRWHSPSEGTLIGARTVPPTTGRGDWTCAEPDHWIFDGTGMKRGDSVPGLVGWEFHGEPEDIDGLTTVASGRTYHPRGDGVYAATVYPGPRRGFVFNAATCWWCDGLAAPAGYVRPSEYTNLAGPDPRIQRITANILNRMLTGR